MTRVPVAAALTLALAGCPAPRTAVRPPPGALPTEIRGGERALAGVVHVVKRGETLWRIARTYGITPGDLMETNGIADPRAVPAGMELFVPGATRVLEVPPLADAEAAPPAGSTSAATPPPDPSPAGPPAPPRSPAAPSRAEVPEVARRDDGSGRLGWPLHGALVGRFGVRDGERHDGIDLAAPEGTPIAAAADGLVLWVGTQAGYGNLVILRHAGGLLTIYAHASEILVADGQRVRRGQAVARVGRTGKAEDPRLHFEVREGTRPRNPLLYLP